MSPDLIARLHVRSHVMVVHGSDGLRDELTDVAADELTIGVPKHPNGCQGSNHRHTHAHTAPLQQRVQHVKTPTGNHGYTPVALTEEMTPRFVTL